MDQTIVATSFTNLATSHMYVQSLYTVQRAARRGTAVDVLVFNPPPSPSIRKLVAAAAAASADDVNR
jgi:hypothetical protein